MSGARQRRRWAVGAISQPLKFERSGSFVINTSKTNAWEIDPTRTDEVRLKLTQMGSSGERSGGEGVRGPTSHAREQPSERVERNQRVDQSVPEVARFIRAAEKSQPCGGHDEHDEVQSCPPGSQGQQQQSADEFDRAVPERVRGKPRPAEGERVQERGGHGQEP